MPDITSDLLPQLKAYRLPELDLGDGFLYPHYGGGSILNIPSTICRLLDAPDFESAPVSPEILSRLGSGYRRVLVILMDALALHRLQRWMAEGSVPIWSHLAQDGLLAPLTSITPSTTSAALTSLWTGRSAAVHGIVGYEMWLKEYGVVANTILHSPMSFRNDAGSLERAGFSPDNFMPLPTLGPQLAAQGVKTFAFQHQSIMNSGLSRMFFKEVDERGFISATDLWINLRQLLEAHPDERMYTWIYWPAVDTFSHHHGPDNEYPAAEFAGFSSAMERLFLKGLSPEARKDTLLILTADHGQITTRLDPHYELRSHPQLVRRLHIMPTGENRLAFFYIRPGQTEAVREYLERTWPNQFTLIDPVYAIQAGLFGPGEPHPGLLDRLGDLIVIAKGDAYLWWSNKDNHLVGRHGGLHPQEMLVPFLATRL